MKRLMVSKKQILVHFFILLFSCGLLLAQEKAYIHIDGFPGQKVPKSLLTLVTVNLDEVEFGEALAVISEKSNLKLNFNSSRIPVHKKVSVNVENAYALEALLDILKKTGTELMVTKDGQLAIVPSKNRNRGTGSVTGKVWDQETKSPLMFTNVFVAGTNLGTTSNKDGLFTINNIPSGNHIIQFNYIGYETKRIDLSIKENVTSNIKVALTPQAIQLGEVVVTPGRFSIMGEAPTVKQTLTKQDLETIPFGEDIYRSITRLPGVSASDFSAKFTVRGGENEEILVLLDGLELYEPFHLKDIEGGAISSIDIAAVEGIDLMTGGFPAEFGDRMSGVFNIKTRKALPEGKKQTSLGLSLMNARVMSEGTFNQNNGSWLISARRGYLDLVLDIMGEQDPPRPVYYDALGKIRYNLNKKHTLSANFLHSGDRLDFVEDDDDVDKTNYSSTYGWLTLKSIPSPNLFVQSMIAYGNLVHDRYGIGYEGDSGIVGFTVSDDNNVDMLSFKQDWNLELSNRWFMKWGLDFKKLTATYDYHSSKQIITWQTPESYTARMDTNRVNLDLFGKKLGLYLSNRFRVFSPLVTELGLRYDYYSYTKDKVISPRINLVYELSKQTFLRFGWGYFYQGQGIHEIRVRYGEDQFYRAELAKHWVGGFEHTFRNGFNLRLEGYYKEMSDVLPDYRNFSNDIEVFPEMLDDGFKLNFDGRKAKGIEAYLKYDRGGKFTWWISYALAYAEENIRNLVFQGVEYPGAIEPYPSKFDQRHTIYLDLNYRPNRKWHFNVSWQFHTGWPYTESSIESRELPDGTTGYFWTYGNFNNANYPSYHRFDVRVNRHFQTSNGRVSAFIALINLYDHKNVRNINYSWVWNSSQNRPYLVGEDEYWFKLLPSVGVSWNFNH